MLPQGGRLVVAAANGLARAAGIGPGLALADARALVPTLATAPAEPVAEARALSALAAWATRYTPWVAPAGADGLFLDLTGCAHLHGGEAALLDDLVRRLHDFGFETRAALAETAGAAWALARFATAGGRPTVLAPGAARAALAALPVAALRIAPAEAEDLARLGLKRIGDLYDLPRAALAPRLGPGLARRLDQALGRVAEPISPCRPAEPDRVHRAFAEPLLGADAIAGALAHLLAALCARLERRGHGARRLALTLYRAGASPLERVLGTHRAVREPAHLARLFADRLDGLDPGFGIEAMTLAALATDPQPPADTALPALDHPAAPADGPATDAALAALADRLMARLGADSVSRPTPRESHLPERAVGRGPAVPGLAETPAAWAAWPLPGARPVRLLDPPEPVEAMAPVPDDPPVMFRWRKVLHRIARADGPERIAPEWWRAPGTTATETRDYYRVEATCGRRFWLYRRGLYRPGIMPSWFLHGIFA